MPPCVSWLFYPDDSISSDIHGEELETFMAVEFETDRLVEDLSVGGWAAHVGCLMLGPYIGKYKYRDGKDEPIPPSSLPLATVDILG